MELSVQDSGLDLPFIIVSGAIGEDTAVAAMKAGAHDYLMKHNLTRLVPAVERELREAQVRRGSHVARDSWVSVMYPEGLNSAKSSGTHQRTDRHEILGEKPSDFQRLS